MKVRLGLGLVVACCSTASVASAQQPKAKAPALSREFVDQLRAPDAKDRRSRTLLVRELGRLERLLRATPKSPDRPLLIRRLAEGYAELAAMAAREKAVADEQLRRAKRLESR